MNGGVFSVEIMMLPRESVRMTAKKEKTTTATKALTSDAADASRLLTSAMRMAMA